MAEQTSRLAIIIDSTGAEKNADSLASALGKMTQAGDQASNSANRVKKATKEESDALSDLLDRIDPVNAALNKLDRQQQELSKFKAKGMIDTETFDTYSKQIEVTRNKLTGFSDQLNKTGISAKQTAAAMRMVPAQLTDIVVSLQGGQAPLTVLLQQGGQLKDMFGGIGPAAKALGGYVLGLVNPFTVAAAAVAVLGLAYYKGSEEQEEFFKSLTLSGNLVGKTTGDLADIATRVSNTSKATTGAAAAVLNQLVSTGKVASGSLENVTRAIVTISDETGIATTELVDNFNQISSDPVDAITKLNDKYHFLTLATYEQIKALQEQGNQQEATRVATDAYAATMQQRANDIHENLGYLESAWNGITGAAKNAWDAMLGAGREKSLQQRLSEAKKRANDVRGGYVTNLFGQPGWQTEAQQEVNFLQNVISLQSDLAGAVSAGRAEEDKAIKTRQEADRVNQQYLSNADRRSKAIKQQDDFLKAGAISAAEYAKNIGRINEMYKDPKSPQQKAYTEDAGTRLLDQLNQQYATLQEQYTATEKIGSSQQALIKWEQQLSDIKGKKTLTAEQKSLLASQDAITAQLQKNAALEKEIAIRKDAEKLTAYQGNLSSGLRNDATDLQNSLNSNTVMSEEQKRQQEISKIVSSYQDKQTELTNQRTTGQISGDLYQQETQALQNALNQRLAMQQSYYAQVDQLNGNWQAGVMNGMQSYLNSVPTLYEASTSAVTSVLSATESAISSNFSAMLEGTESLSEGFQGIAVGMGQAVIDALTKMAAQWLVYEAVQLLVGKTTAASSVSALTGNAIAMSAMAQLNAYASTAAIPIVGPALAPAAMAEAAAISTPLVATVTAASASSLAGFQTGGYTGNGGVSEIAGVVHGKEYVFDAASTKRIGLSNLEAIRNGGMDATLSKPGFGTGNKNVSSSGGSSQTNHISQVINMPQSPGMTQQEMDAVLKLNNKQLVNELSNQTLEGKGQFGKSLRAAQGRGNRMT